MIARAFAVVLIFPPTASFTTTSTHVMGMKNTAADALSGPKQFPTWTSTYVESLEMKNLQAYRIPDQLLSHLRWIVSAPQIKWELESATLTLLRLEPTTLLLGLSQRDSTTSLLSTRPPKKRGKSSRRTHK